MKNYFPELDALRGAAALMVFFSHAIGLIAPTVLATYLQQALVRIL